jgi:hypothetical protein
MSDPTGFAQPGDYAGDWNGERSRIHGQLAKLQTAIPVEVMAVHGGGLAPVGYVDVRPLVSQIGGDGSSVPHGLLTNLPYNRLQGGTNAVVIDPAVGDIGIAVFASRDISSVKNARGAAAPGSWRMHSHSDGMYIGGILNAAPTQYIKFDSSGITVYSPQAVTVQAPVINAEATESASVTAPSILLGASGQTLLNLVNSLFEALYNGHDHNVTAVGSPTGVPNQQMGASHMTSTVQGG